MICSQVRLQHSFKGEERELLHSTANGQLTTIDDSLLARNVEMNAVLGRMATAAQELAQCHSGDDDGIYLAYADFHSYLLVDAACMKELNQWFLKQLYTLGCCQKWVYGRALWFNQ